MPQMDSLTFFNQLFWAVLIFFIFYSLSVSYILPTIARILKTRTKKLILAKSSSDYLSEKSELESKIDLSFFNTTNVIKNVLLNAKSNFSNYQQETKEKNTRNVFEQSNKKYINSLVSVILKKDIMS